MEKEYLYVGHYIDAQGNYILKIGTTNDLARRRAIIGGAKRIQCQKRQNLPMIGICLSRNITLCGLRIKIGKTGKKRK